MYELAKTVSQLMSVYKTHNTVAGSPEFMAKLPRWLNAFKRYDVIPILNKFSVLRSEIQITSRAVPQRKEGCSLYTGTWEKFGNGRSKI